MEDWSMLYQYLSAKEYSVVNEYFISIRKCRICPMFVLGRQPWQLSQRQLYFNLSVYKDWYTSHFFWPFTTKTILFKFLIEHISTDIEFHILHFIIIPVIDNFGAITNFFFRFSLFPFVIVASDYVFPFHFYQSQHQLPFVIPTLCMYR